MNLIPILVPLGGVCLGLGILLTGRVAFVFAIAGTILFGVALVLALAGM